MRKKKYNIRRQILASVLAAAVALTSGAFSNIKAVSAATTQCGSAGDGTVDAGDVSICYEITGDEVSVVGMEYDDSIDASAAVCEIPNTVEGKPVTTIKTGAFGSIGMPFCRLVIPDNVNVLEDRLSTNHGLRYSTLSSISIGKGVSDIKMPLFQCANLPLSSISISDKNKVYESRNNAIIEKGTNALVMGSQQTKIPEDTKSIGSYAFYSIGNTTSPANNEAFCALNRDKNNIFIIPEGVESIGSYAFSSREDIFGVGPLYKETVFIPNTVKNIGESALNAVKSLIVYNDSAITSIGVNGPLNCNNENFIYLPSGVTGLDNISRTCTSSDTWISTKKAALYIKSKSAVAKTLNGTTTSKLTLPTSSDECAELNWPGHKFLGWYLDKSCTKWPVTEIPKNSRGTIPVYAKWAESHTISYNTAANGGTSTAPADVTEKEDGTDIIDGDDCSFAISAEKYTATKGNSLGNWTHVGWNTDKDAHASGDGDNPSLTVDEDELVYAIFKLDIPVQFTDAQGDRNENATLWNTDTSGTITLPSIRVKSGWDAIGWTTSTTADAETAKGIKQAGDTITVTQKGLHYYALYKKTIFIDKDGDGNPDESEEDYTIHVKPGDTDGITAPSKPDDKPGYNFEGWVPNPNPDDENPVKPGGTIKPGEDGITAVFTPISYSVKFHANNQTSDTHVQNFVYDKDAELDANPFRYSGYHFDGWATSGTSATAVYKDRQRVKNLTTTDHATIDLYAVWAEDSGSSNPTLSPTPSAAPEETTTPAPTASVIPTATTSPIPTASATPMATVSPEPTASPTATASPTPSVSPAPTAAVYNINYELNGGIFSVMPETSYTAGKSTILPTVNMVARKGYTFNGWYDNKYYVGNPVTSIGQSNKGDVTFYAKWTQETYKIDYVLNGGTFKEYVPISYEAGNTAILPQDSAVSKDGYIFAGWYDNNQFTGVSQTSIPAGETGNKIYYAKWTAKTYSVTLHLNGGKLDTDSRFLYGYGEEFTLPIPTRENYSFAGWYDSADFSGKTFSKVTISDSNKTYYAKWKSSPSGNIELKPDDNIPADNVIQPVGTTITYGKGIYIVNNDKNGEASVTYKVTSSKSSVTLVIPDTITVNGVVYKVTAISSSLIKNKAKLKSVKIGKYVKRIPDNMFAGCKALIKVTGGKNVIIIGKNAFKNCVKLNKMSVFSNKKLKRIGKSAFLNCKKLKSITIGPKVTNIKSGAFKGCSNLRKVTMKSKRLKVIDKNVFMNCKKLKSITIRSKVSSIQTNAFKGCRSLKKIVIKSKILKKAGKNALKGIHKKCRIKVPASKFSRYKKLLKNKGQKRSVKILK